MTSFARVLELPDRLTLLDRLPRGGVVAEIGVQQGDFAAEILRRSQPRLLVLIDGWRHRPDGPYLLDKSNVPQAEHDRSYARVCERFREELHDGRLVILRGLSGRALTMLTVGWLDWVYLDADHSYEAVRKDLAWCSRKVKADGLIAGNDYVKAPYHGIGGVQAVAESCQTCTCDLVGS